MFITEYFDVDAAESEVKPQWHKIKPSFLIKNNVVFMPNSFSLNKPNKKNSNSRIIHLQKLYILHSTSTNDNSTIL